MDFVEACDFGPNDSYCTVNTSIMSFRRTIVIFLVQLRLNSILYIVVIEISSTPYHKNNQYNIETNPT